MDLHFGTPARLERQIAQDLMDTHSEFDLSMPGADTRDISASLTTTRTPLAPSHRHNSSFFRPSDSSDASVSSPAKHTHLATPHATTRPVTLATAIQNAHKDVANPNPNPNPNPNSISSPSSTSSVSDSPLSTHFPDPYSHVPSSSPPLTSTPQRTIGAASTVGSRSRTTITARPSRSNTAQHIATHPYDDTTKTSASRATRSARSASAVLDDLTESSIAPEQASDHEQDARATSSQHHHTQTHAQHHEYDGRDLVLRDVPPPPSTSRNVSPAASQAPSTAATIDWQQRRAQRRQLVHNDESAIDDDDDADKSQSHTQAHTHSPLQPTRTLATRADSVAETEFTTTAYSSPAAARLARQALLANNTTASSQPADSATSTPSRPIQADPATPNHASAPDERARMKQYLLNSVKATDRSRSRTAPSSDAHSHAIERLKAQAQLHRTPSSLSDGDAHTPDDASSATTADPTPRRRMDRLGKANTFAAGRTPLPKGGVAELLRRGALFSVSDASEASSAAAATPQSPLHVASSSVDAVKDDEAASAVGSTTTYSEASSNDLALAPNASKHGAMGLRANTSFPGLGAADAGTQANSVARPRVDAAKLALYQSKLNARLDAENDALKRERDQLLQKLAQLQTASSSSTSAELQAVNQQLQAERQRADALDKEAQELADLVDEKEREIESLKPAQGAPPSSENHEQDLRNQIQELRTLLNEKQEDLEEIQALLQREREQMQEQVQQAKAFSFETLDKIENERDEALERVRELQAQVSELKSCHADMDGDHAALQLRVRELQAETQSLREKLESTSQSTSQLESLREQTSTDAVRIRGLERRLNAANAQLAKGANARDQSDQSQSMQLESLQNELREAQTYIAELEARVQAEKTLTTSSVQDQKIALLQRQKAELEERVEQYREMISKGVGTNLANLKNAEAADGASLPPTTPARTNLGSSPLPKSVLSLRNISALKTPRSPGALSEASWLYNESSLGAANVVDRITYLEGALDQANASIDAKLQQLDQAGVAHLTLAERLEHAHERIASLQAEIERLRMLGGRGSDTSTDTSHASASPNKSVSRRQKVFADVHAQLEALKSRWAADHDKLQQREREVERRERELHDRSTEKRQYEEVLAELERFKEAASSLQHDLQRERAKQRTKLAETRAMEEQKESIEASLSRTHAELEVVKRKLEHKTGGLEDLGRQCMQPESSQLDDCAEERLAERFQAARSEVEVLRAERNELLQQRAQLHSKFATTNEKYAQVLGELVASREALAEHQAQLDEQIEQMQAAHAALRCKKAAYEKMAGDRDRLRAERDLIVHDVGMFEHELRRLRHEADRQGADLQALRAERQHTQDQQRTHLLRQVQTLQDQLNCKTHELDRIKSKLPHLENVAITTHPPAPMQHDALLATNKMHNAECKGLLLHISYLKLKLIREMDLRADLVHQKSYISLLLHGLMRSDTQLEKLILHLHLHRARNSTSVASAPPRNVKRTWTKPLNAALAIGRMRVLANKAHRLVQIKLSLQTAHKNVQATRCISAKQS